MCQVVEINDIRDLDGYQMVWRHLLQQTRGATFFQSLDWLQCYWRCYGDDQRLRCLIVKSDDQVIGILPLVVCRERTRLGTIDVLTYPLQDWGSFYGPIGPNPTATLMAAMRYLAAGRADCDLIDMRWVDSARVDCGRHNSAMKMAGLPAERRTWSHVAVIDTACNWAEFFGRFSSKKRNNYRRTERRLEEQGTLSYVRYRPQGAAYGEDDPRWDLYEACEQIAAKSWQGQLDNNTTLSSPKVRELLRDAHQAAARAGALDMNVLFLDGQPLAFGYNYHWDGYVTALRTGYDANFREGAGVVLFSRMIRGSVEGDDHTFDLGGRHLSWKKDWCTEIRRADHFVHYPPLRPRAQAIRLKRRLSGWVFGEPAATSGRLPVTTKSAG